jgi:hypothetical protein
MTDQQTPRLALPLLVAGQAQKEVTHNEALLRLDLMVSGTAQSAGGNAPPGDPMPGQCWVTGSDPQGAWAGHPHQIAGWSDNGWRFVAPSEGLRLWLVESGAFLLFAQGEWRAGGAFGEVFVEGLQVVGPRRPDIVEPSGGQTVDGAARAAIVAVLEALRAHGLIGSINL